VRTKDGRLIWALLNITFRWDGDRIVGATVVAHDITERRKAEEKLRESEERLRALVRASSDVVYRMSPDWKEMRQLHGRDFIPDTETPSDNWREKYIHPDDQPHMTAVINETIRTKGVFELEHRVIRVDGTLGWTFSRAIPLLNENGEIVEWFGAASDVTERKRAEEEIRRSHDELEMRVQERTEELARSQQRLQQLASQLLLAQEKERKRVAVELHDGLLSELAATRFLLEGKLSLLERGKISDLGELKKIGEVLGIAIKEARRIMNNLHPSVLDELGLIAAMRWSCGEYQKSYPHIKVEAKIGVTERDISESIRLVIYRVLQEALNNFARHGKGDRVELSLSKSAGAFEFMIRDNGQGFDVEAAQKGLGLESMRERVELSGGEFQIESVIGHGTTIRAIWR
jgi:signal transduction histidine kinase